MSGQHSREEILSVMKKIEVAAVSTSAGEKLRTRMVHYAIDEDFNIYMASLKGDPKTVQITHHPSLSLLVFDNAGDINESKEVEVSGNALFVKEPRERELALNMIAKRSFVCKYFIDSGNSDMLDCIKIVPDTIKFRIFKEVVKGMSPTVVEFPHNRQVVSDWHLMNMKIKNWLMALRAAFLTASVVPVLLGTAIAWFTSGTLHWGFFLLTLLGVPLINLGTNLMNDYSDHKSGNDEANHEFIRPFTGGSRVIQLGLLTPLEVLSGSLFFFVLSALVGFYLAWARGPLVLILGAVGFISGVFYTWGPFSWVKRGIGEALVGINLGILSTLGAYYVQTQSFNWLPVIAAIPVSLLIAMVLYINEFPDYTADKQVGKKTLVVRLGREKAVTFYALAMIGVYLSIGVGVATGVLPLTGLLGLVTLPLAIRAIQYVRKYHSSSFDLIPANALTITSHLATGLLLTLAFAWKGLSTQGPVYVVILGVVFVGFAIFMYRHIEKQKNIFLGLKRSVR